MPLLQTEEQFLVGIQLQVINVTKKTLLLRINVQKDMRVMVGVHTHFRMAVVGFHTHLTIL